VRADEGGEHRRPSFLEHTIQISVPNFEIWSQGGLGGLCRGLVQFSTLHHSGTLFSLDNDGSFFRPENVLPPFSGGVSDVGPQKIAVGRGP
jgi:hypothetical protein